MRASLTLGRIRDIPIGVHSSWFLVAALVVWSLASGYFPEAYPNQGLGTYWLLGAVTAILFFGSVLLHELGHSVIALREGVPVRSITLFIFGGVAQIQREPPTAGAEFRIAIAGPIASLVLAGAFGVVGLTASVNPVAAAPAVYLERINLMLALFNLIPGFPLDGGRVLRAILWHLRGGFREATRWASYIGRAVAFIFILYGVSQLFFGNFFDGLWIAFIGWFLNNAAESSYQQLALRDLLGGVTVRDVMRRQCPTISGEVSLDRLVNDRILGTGQRCFFVGGTEGLHGLITLHNIKSVPRERWSETSAAQTMTPVSALHQARPDEDVLQLLQRMDEEDVNQMPVMENGHLLGMVTREDLLHYIRTRTELGI